jgi:hypothetical protein
MKKRRRPLLVCSACRKGTAYDFALNQQHLEHINGQLCTGVFRLALEDECWAECQTCGATGQVDERYCDDCGGNGWQFVEGSQGVAHSAD